MFCGRKIKKSMYLSNSQIFPLPHRGAEAPRIGGGSEDAAGEEGHGKHRKVWALQDQGKDTTSAFSLMGV